MTSVPKAIPATCAADAIHECEVIGDGVFPPHSFEHAIVAALERQVEIGTELFPLGHTVDKTLLDGRRLDRGEPYAVEAANRAETIDEIGERAAAVVVRPHVYAGDDDLAVPLFHERARLADAVVEVAAPRGTSALGDDAVRTDEAAPFLNFEIRAGMRRVEPHRIDGEVLARRGFPHDRGFGELHRLGDDIREPHLVRRSHDVIETFDGLQFLDVRLRVAPDGGDTRVGVPADDRADRAPALGGRLVGEGAGVDDAHVGLLGVIDEGVPPRDELPDEDRRLRLVEPAPQSLESHLEHAKNRTDWTARPPSPLSS